jgi:hypothetical protein
MAPGYRPPQRYLVPLYLRLGEQDKAQVAFQKLRLIEPSFSLDAMRATSYPSTAVREAGLPIQVRPAEVRVGEVRSGQERLGEACHAEVRPAEARLAQIRARARLTAPLAPAQP